MNTPHIRLDWNDCAAALDVPGYTDTLPTTLDCPLCKASKSLTIFQTTIHDTVWHHCKACGANGDLFEFAASVLGMSIEATFVELAKRGVASLLETDAKMIENYEHFYLKHVRKSRVGWAGCETYFKKPTKAVNELLVGFNLQLKKWEDFVPRPERYVAATHVRDLERELGTQFKHKLTVNGEPNNLDTLPLRFPNGWSDVLVFPYECAPGAIMGFLCVGYRHGTMRRLFTRVRVTNNTFGAKLPQTDGGLWGLHTAVHGKSTYGNYVIALEDPILALRIQSRHALMSNTPLPIVSWLFTNAEATQPLSWAAVAQKHIVIVTPKLTPSAIHAAYTSGGWLSVLNMTESEVNELAKNNAPELLMKNFIRRALPWRDAVRRWITTVPENTAKDLFNSLLLHCADAEAITSEFADQLQPTPARGVRCARILLSGKALLVVENETGWFLRVHTTDYVQIADFTVRLNAVHVRKHIKVGAGTIYFKNTEIPVTLNQKELVDDAAFERRIVNRCLESGLGHPRVNITKCSLLKLTRLFNEPVVYKFPSDKL